MGRGRRSVPCARRGRGCQATLRLGQRRGRGEGSGGQRPPLGASRTGKDPRASPRSRPGAGTRPLCPRGPWRQAGAGGSREPLRDPSAAGLPRELALADWTTEMDLQQTPGSVSQPASAALRLSCSPPGTLNPRPLLRDAGELLVEEYLSPRKLRALAGVDDLQAVTALEMQVDTTDSSLGSLGAYLPRLRELKLNGSLLVSVRDLGTTLSHLQVLWLAGCGLSDLDGISSCSSLRELYVGYNHISDLSQLPWLDHLEVLDLEGNHIEDINQMQYLGLCGKLRCLTVEGNPICLRPTAEAAEEPGYNYRAAIRKLIPHLEYLDAAPAGQTEGLPPKPPPEEWLLSKEGGSAGDSSWSAGALAVGGVRTANPPGSGSGGGQQQEDGAPGPGAEAEQPQG
ncbi:leucine-rich repeat-containing protein 56 [Melanerpes formicivorus]|uniref:leucine-rich repeat-containing protein 56 n=1 Tax=Melanerpes formicivorus TaxID=211600 RepID=UPI00359021D8